MNTQSLRSLVVAASLTWASSVAAGQWETTGFVGLDSQAFWQDARFEGQEGALNLSLIAQPEFSWRSDDDRHKVRLVGFGRVDGHDDERTHLDVREAYWAYEGRGWDVNVGVNKVFWGIAESRHLVDVINQTDLVEDIDQEDKLGQPMLNINLERDFGRFQLFVLPWFRERAFPGIEGRLRTPLPVDTGSPVYESSAEQRHVDLAVRYSHFFGDVDFGVYVFDGTSREPGLVVAESGDRLLPVYEQMTQFGIDVQYTRDAWLWKLEAIARDASSDAFVATVGGFEYSFYGVGGGNTDLGVLVEYLYDGRDRSAPPTLFDNDVFAGVRLAFNDASDTSILAGATMDIETDEWFFNLEAERRFGDDVMVELRLRTFSNSDPEDLLYAIERDDYVQLRLSWYY